MDKEKEINFMPDEAVKVKKDITHFRNDYCFEPFPPERIAEMNEDLLWNV